MVQAVTLKALQHELSALPSALALIPATMAIVTLMIVILHVIVNAEDIVAVKSLRKWIGTHVQSILRMFNDKK